MTHVTKLDIVLTLEEGKAIEDVVSELPDYSASSFSQMTDGRWRGDFIISCSVAPELAEGDFIDDFAPYFRALLDLRSFNSAEYEFQIAVGSPAADSFDLDASSVALIAALGAPIKVRKNGAEQGSADQSATALESTSEGIQKPQPESEVRPQ